MHVTVLLAATLMAGTGLSPQADVVEDRVDLIEVNHVYDAKGEHVFDQTIFYEWSDSQQRYQVRAWRLLKEPAQVPVRNWKRGDYQCTWRDGLVLRQVRAPAVRETWTQHDPELLARENLPREYRRELTSPRLPTVARSADGN